MRELLTELKKIIKKEAAEAADGDSSGLSDKKKCYLVSLLVFSLYFFSQLSLPPPPKLAFSIFI